MFLCRRFSGESSLDWSDSRSCFLQSCESRVCLPGFYAARNLLDEDGCSRGLAILVAFKPEQSTMGIILFGILMLISLVTMHMITGAIRTEEVDHGIIVDKAGCKHFRHAAKGVLVVLADNAPA